MRLRLRDDSDIPAIVAWCNDQQATRWMATGRVPMVADLCMQTWFPPNGMTYIVEIDLDGQDPVRHVPIGIAGLFEIDLFSRKAELRILLGARRHEGFGRQAVEALLAIGFGRVNLHRIWLGTAEDNVAARRCFTGCGFLDEGTLIHDLWRDGWHNDVRMGILEDRWRALHAPMSAQPLGTQLPNGHAIPGPAGATSMHSSEPEALSRRTDPVNPFL